MYEWCFWPQFCITRLTRPGTTQANEMNFNMIHATGARLITRHVDLQSIVLWLPARL